MTLQDAIKSGKNFRRKGWSEENFFIKNMLKEDGYNTINFFIGDVLADDWEIEAPSVDDRHVFITREKLEELWWKSVRTTAKDTFAQLAKELGL